MKHVCKHPEQQGKALRGVLAYLNANAAGDVTVTRKKTLQLRFTLDGKPFRASLGISSRTERDAKMTIDTIRTQARRAGLVLPAAGAMA